MPHLAMKVEKRYTYSDYMTRPDEECWEIINGIPYAMSPAPNRKHQAMAGELYLQLQFYSKEQAAPAKSILRLLTYGCLRAVKLMAKLKRLSSLTLLSSVTTVSLTTKAAKVHRIGQGQALRFAISIGQGQALRFAISAKNSWPGLTQMDG